MDGVIAAEFGAFKPKDLAREKKGGDESFSFAAAEMKRIRAQPPASPAKAQVTAAAALCPADS